MAETGNQQNTRRVCLKTKHWENKEAGKGDEECREGEESSVSDGVVIKCLPEKRTLWRKALQEMRK